MTSDLLTADHADSGHIPHHVPGPHPVPGPASLTLTLLNAQPSPFASKVRAAARFLDLPLTCDDTVPLDSTPRLLSVNPLSKIPALIIQTADQDRSQTLFDSTVICQALDEMDGGHRLLPSHGPARWQALRDEALSDGICDAAVLMTAEHRRPENLQSPYWKDRWTKAITRGLDTLVADGERLRTGAALPRLAIACMLDYLDLRHGEWFDWRTQHAVLESVSLRP